MADLYMLSGMDSSGKWITFCSGENFDYLYDDYELILREFLFECAVCYGIKTENYDLVRLHRQSWKEDEDLFYDVSGLNKKLKSELGV